MSGLRLMCPICTDDFQENDDIYSTSCGHIYHFSCMRQWQSRATSCPQCRHHSPTSHKLYLIFNDAPAENTASASASAEDQEDLNAKLESSVDKINELNAQLQEAEINFYHLQEQYTIEQELRKRSDQRIAEFTNNEENFLNLHAQYSEIETRIHLLEEENERLSLENEYKAEEISRKSREIATLQTNRLRFNDNQQLREQFSDTECHLRTLQEQNSNLILENEYKSKELALKVKELTALKTARKGHNDASSDIAVNTKVNVLEQKLKCITVQLEKEIANNMQLSIEKIKLKSQMQRLEIQNNSKAFSKTSLANKATSASGAIAQDTNPNRAMQHSIVLQKFPYNEIRYPLENVVLSIAAKIGIPNANIEDIVKVNVLDRIHPNKKPKDVCMYVEFRTGLLKSEFLAKANLLKNDETFKGTFIKEYIDKQIHNIFLYAVRNLRGVGFRYIDCKANCVVAKRNEQEFRLYSKKNVDELLCKAMNSPASLPRETEEKIDEDYYKTQT
ncbi:E3 ubiquitin-protein ligase TRAIP [Stomoxys calcitrans]|uniref:E3 ubiquitin-protein ligase TRAIP n=1 Tax=Stomoxys calcitrans TaxID=35570 RepID=UPI0027E25784|nr:E3 ubiquitin-protein ligase TRAIP [Stomoxys calcitrans]